MLEVIYRVVMLKADTGRWETWTNYTALYDAVEAATGLVTKPDVKECNILAIRATGGKILAAVGLKDGRPYIRKAACELQSLTRCDGCRRLWPEVVQTKCPECGSPKLSAVLQRKD